MSHPSSSNVSEVVYRLVLRQTAKRTQAKILHSSALGLQLCCFGFFVIASLRFHKLLRKKLRNLRLPNDTNWRFFLGVINVVSVIILIRTTFRFVEYVLDSRNYLSDHEAFFYCLHAVPIILVALGYFCMLPGIYLSLYWYLQEGAQTLKTWKGDSSVASPGRGSEMVKLEISRWPLCRPRSEPGAFSVLCVLCVVIWDVWWTMPSIFFHVHHRRLLVDLLNASSLENEGSSITYSLPLFVFGPFI